MRILTLCSVLLVLVGCKVDKLTPNKPTNHTGCGSPQQCYELALAKMEEARQFWVAQREQFLANALPVGTVVAYAAESLPPQGWLACNGDEKPADRYPRLAKLLVETYGKAVTPGHFKLPDYTGYFLRGWDPYKRRDKSTRSPSDNGAVPGPLQIGTRQDDMVGSHSHQTTIPLGGGDPNYPQNFGKYAADGNVERHIYPSSDVVGPHEETRPKNLSVIYLIRAE